MPFLYLIFCIIIPVINAYVKYRAETKEELGTIDYEKKLLAFQNNQFAGEVDDYDRVLSAHLPYYGKLSLKAKIRFLRRLQNFIDTTNFYSVGSLDLTQEMYVLISGTAIQLTFGLKNYLIPSLENIYIHESTFYHQTLDQYHKGNVSMSGDLHVAWDHFLKGHHIEDDKINLGIHEMSHALEFSYLLQDNYESLFGYFYQKLLNTQFKVFNQIKSGRLNYLRDYAGTDMHELFAVSIEYYFENPKELKDQIPELYYRLRSLLNQDTLNPENDFRIERAKKSVQENIEGNLTEEITTDVSTAEESKQDIILEKEYRRNVEPENPYMHGFVSYALLIIPVILLILLIFAPPMIILVIAVIVFFPILIYFLTRRK